VTTGLKLLAVLTRKTAAEKKIKFKGQKGILELFLTHKVYLKIQSVCSIYSLELKKSRLNSAEKPKVLYFKRCRFPIQEVVRIRYELNY